MEFHYAIDHAHRLILVRRSGNWNAEQFTQSFDIVRKGVGDHTDYNIVSEMRNLRAQVSSSDVAGLAETLKERPMIDGETILIVDKPLETALAMLYKNATSNTSNISIFSTSEGVSEHLGIEVEPLFSEYLPTP